MVECFTTDGAIFEKITSADTFAPGEFYMFLGARWEFGDEPHDRYILEILGVTMEAVPEGSRFDGLQVTPQTPFIRAIKQTIEADTPRVIADPATGGLDLGYGILTSGLEEVKSVGGVRWQEISPTGSVSSSGLSLDEIYGGTLWRKTPLKSA